MEELLRTNDAVLLSFIDALLNEGGIPHVIADHNMSVLDGSIGAIPRRVMVVTDRLAKARRILDEAGLSDELPDWSPQD